MSSEKRKIRLKKGEPEQTHWFNGAVSARPKQVIELGESQARQAVRTGKFEYASRTVGSGSEEAKTPGETGSLAELPEDFPYRKELAEVGIHTLGDLNSADDETVKGAKQVSDARLKDIRAAAEQLTTQGEKTDA